MKFIIKKRLKEIKSYEITQIDIEKANKVLFVVYSRFGDGIMAFKIIKEFVDKYPKKEYFLLTSHQLLPYAKEILSHVTINSANKRNPIQFFNIIKKLKNFNADIGFNPWSHGDDSEFFTSYAKKYMFFKYFSQINNFTKTTNLYDRIRYYLYLDIKSKKIINFTLDNINQIVITPLSTDVTKNISIDNLDILIDQLKKISNNIIIATPKDLGYENQFIFKKSKKNSEQFLELLKNSDLLVSVDSGPLHIGLSIGIKTIAIFGPTAPETILDYNSKVKIIRDEKLFGVFCFVKECKNPICINNIISNIFNHEVNLSTQIIELKEKKCPII